MFGRNFVQKCLGVPGSDWPRKYIGNFFFFLHYPDKRCFVFFCSYTRCLSIIGIFEGLVIGRDTFSVLAPVLGPSQKNGYVTSSTVHGGQHDTTHVTFELLMHAAFVADKNWGFMPEPARTEF